MKEDLEVFIVINQAILTLTLTLTLNCEVIIVINQADQRLYEMQENYQVAIGYTVIEVDIDGNQVQEILSLDPKCDRSNVHKGTITLPATGLHHCLAPSCL